MNKKILPTRLWFIASDFPIGKLFAKEISLVLFSKLVAKPNAINNKPLYHLTNKNLKMTKKELSDLTDEELLKEKGKVQHNKIFNATFIGLCFGVFIYSAINNGFKLFTFAPLILIYVFVRNGKKTKELEEELKSRNL